MEISNYLVLPPDPESDQDHKGYKANSLLYRQLLQDHNNVTITILLNITDHLVYRLPRNVLSFSNYLFHDALLSMMTSQFLKIIKKLFTLIYYSQFQAYYSQWNQSLHYVRENFTKYLSRLTTL